jgi:pyridoxine 4-dehydrogenase
VNLDELISSNSRMQLRELPISSAQFEFSLLRKNIINNGILDACKELDIPVLAYAPLGMGLLTGKYTRHNIPPYLQYFRFHNLS